MSTRSTGRPPRRLSVGWSAVVALCFGCTSGSSTGPSLIGGGGGGGGGGTGSVQITVATTGSNLDENGYLLVFDENTSQPVGINGGVSLTGFSVGAYQVTLADVALNCEVQGAASTRSFSVSAGATTRLDFEVDCT